MNSDKSSFSYLVCCALDLTRREYFSFNTHRIMKNLSSESLRNAVNAYIKAPTEKDRAKLTAAMEEYKELWITARASGGTSKSGNRTPSTSYSQAMKAKREIGGIAVELALQERTSATADDSWWVLSWRTKYSPSGKNRRFYFTKDGIWTIPAAKALEMMEELESKGAMGQEYLDHRRAGFVCDTRVSTRMTPAERKNMNWPALRVLKKTGVQIPFFVVNSDPNDDWKKVLIVNTDTGTATFRSITKDPGYMPKKVLRPGADWWLDNSMMDANVQQMKAFYSNLRDLSL